MTTRATSSTPMAYVCGDDGECAGFILKRGKLGFEAHDREARSLGLFQTAAKAASAILDSAANERGAG